MSAATARNDGAAGGRDRWFEKSPGDPLQRIPAMADVMTAAARTWTESFNTLSASPGELIFRGLRPSRVEDLPARREGRPIFASLKVASWESLIGLSLDRAVISAVVEAFFGGSEGETDAGDDRPVSPVEARIVDVIGGQVAAALTAGFLDLLPTRFEFDRTRPKPEATFLGKPSTPVIVATFDLKTVGRSVEIDVILVQSALDALGENLGGPDTPALDTARWSHQLKHEVGRAEMRLLATMAMRPMNLGDVAGLHVGQVLELPVAAGLQVLLSCSDETLFRCELGRSLGFYTVRVEEAMPAAARPPSRKD